MSNHTQPMKSDQLQPRKSKSYREADTTMRLHFVAQQDAVSDKVDEVMASFRHAPKHRRPAKDAPVLNAAGTTTYRHTLRQHSPIGKLGLAGVILLCVAIGAYFLTASSQKTRDIGLVTAPVPSQEVSAPTAPEVTENALALQAPDDAVTTPRHLIDAPPAPKDNPSATTKLKAPVKSNRKSSRYSEDI